jgi:transcriptional regulator with XRE-family HTH domain
VLIGEAVVPKGIRHLLTLMEGRYVAWYAAVMSIGSIIREERKRNGWTQTQIADQLGVSRGAVSQWEINQTVPSVPLLKQLASLLAISIDRLVSELPKSKSDSSTENVTEIEPGIDPVLLAAWQRMTAKERKKLVQVALILSEK